jgi:hypothetical protein
MKTRLVSGLALAALCAMTAFAGEPARPADPSQKTAAAKPVKLTDAQLDTISAGGAKPGTSSGGGSNFLGTNLAGRPSATLATAVIRKIGG